MCTECWESCVCYSNRSTVRKSRLQPCRAKPSSRTLVDAIIILPPLAVPLMSPFRVATVRIISRKSTERTPQSPAVFEGVEMRCFQPRRSLGCIPTAVGAYNAHMACRPTALQSRGRRQLQSHCVPKAGGTMCCAPDSPQCCIGVRACHKLRQATPTADAAAAAGVQQG